MCTHHCKIQKQPGTKVVTIFKKLKPNLLPYIWGIALLLNVKSYAQTGNKSVDTVTVDINTVEQRFVSQDLAIIAARYDVDIAKTNVLQSKLWYNPNVTYSQTLYNNGTDKFFDTSNPGNSTDYNGEWSVQIQQ